MQKKMPVMVSDPSELQQLPIGTQDFEQLRINNMVYVDKTRQIYEIARLNSAFFLARPRRFGKSLLCSTLKYLFQGRRDLFKDLWIDQSNWDWKQHPVIYISMAELRHGTVAILTTELTDTLAGIAASYNITMQKEHPATMFKKLMVALATQEQVVVIIDEYDKPMINQLHDLGLLNEFRVFFKEFYGSLKDCGEHLRFLFITGVSQFSMVSIFSDINHLNKITLSESAETICGYTQQELESVFAAHILQAEAKDTLSHDEFLLKIKRWYNGYYFTEPGPGVQSVYNPFSILKFLYDKKFRNYWFTTGTPSFVIELFKKHHFQAVDFENVRAVQEDLEDFTPEEPELKTMLYQTGYLTIKSYDSDSGVYALAFPNLEVASSCAEQLLKRLFKLKHIEVRDHTLELRGAFVANQLTLIRGILTRILAQIPYDMRPDAERGYQIVFYMLLRLMGLEIRVEEATAIGRIDAVIKTPQHVFIIEFKIRGTAQDAMQQIKDKRYADKYLLDGLPIRLMGVVFDPDQAIVSDILIEDFDEKA